jgi:hypothetical protein
LRAAACIKACRAELLPEDSVHVLQFAALCYDTHMATDSKRKHHKNAWFVAVRGSYLPVSWKGWLTYIPFVAYVAYSTVIAFGYTGNTLKAIVWVVPNWIAAAVIMTWLAKITS